MRTRFVSVDRRTPLLLPHDLREWVPGDDMVHFVLEAVEEMKLVGLSVKARGTVSVDGTKIRANASKHKRLRYDRAGELGEQLELEVNALLQQAEKVDNQDSEEAQRWPEEIARREALQAKLEPARKRLEARAQARAQAEQEQYLNKLKAREGRRGRRKGPNPKSPSAGPAPEEQINLVDEDSRLMRKNKRSEYEQSYKAQAVVDAEGSQLVWAARVSQCARDRNELAPEVEQIPAQVGPPSAVLADAGYDCEQQVNGVQSDQTEGSRRSAVNGS